MKIAQYNEVVGPILKKQPTSASQSTGEQPGFMDYLKEALGTVDNLQKDAASSAERLALGDESYLHNTIIAYEKANLALQLTLEVRNRVLEAYQEIMRLQM